MPGPHHARRQARTLEALVIVASVTVGIAVAVDPLLALGLAVLAPTAVVVVRRPALVAILVLLYGTVKYSVQQALPAGAGSLAAAEAVLVACVFVSALVRRPRATESTAVRGLEPYLLLGAFVATAVASWALAEGTALQLMAGIRALVTMPLLAASVALSATEKDLEFMWRAGVLVTIIQVPIATLQFLSGGLSRDVDLVNGTLGFGGSNLLGVWMLAASAASLHVFVRKGSRFALVAAIAFAAVIVMCGSRIGILLLPLALMVVGWLSVRGREIAVSGMRFVGAVALVGAAFMLVLAAVYAGYAQSGVRIGTVFSDLNPSSLIERQTRIGDYSVPRLAYFSYGWKYLGDNSEFWPIGTGPASAGSGSASAALSDYESSPFATGLRVRSQGLATVSSLSRVVTKTSQMVSTLVEYGPVGFALLMSFYVTVGVRCARVLLRTSEWSTRAAAVTAAFTVFFLFATIGSAYAVVWEGLNIIGLGFWWSVLLSGAVSTATSVTEA